MMAMQIKTCRSALEADAAESGKPMKLQPQKLSDQPR